MSYSLYFSGNADEPAEWMKDKDGRVFAFTRQSVALFAKRKLETTDEKIVVLPTPDGVETVRPKLEDCFDAKGVIVEDCT